MSKIYEGTVVGTTAPVWQGVLDDPINFSSSKYNENHASSETLARLFIPMTQKEAEQYKAAVRANVKSHDLSDILDSLVVTVQNNAVNGGGYFYFLLAQASEPLQEAVNIVKTSGDQYVTYTYGSQPPVFSYSGILMNTLQDDWRTAFLLLYMFLIRASELAKYQKSVVLAYDNLLITGSFLSQQQTFNAESQRHSMVNFNLLVKKITILNRQPLHTSSLFPGSAAEDPAAFGGAKARDLLGLVSSVSGIDVAATSSLKVAADSPARSSGDTPPTAAEAQQATVDALVDVFGNFVSLAADGRTRVGYKVGSVFPEAIRYPNLDAPLVE